MIGTILSITIPFFLMGALMMAIAGRKSTPVEQAKRWKKFLIYVAIVHLMLGATVLNGFYLLMAVAILVSFGAVELRRAVASIASLQVLRIAVAGYVIAASAFVLCVLRSPAGGIEFLYLVVVGFDGFSEVSGHLFGRAQLVRTLSPGKTVEGALGGAAGALAIALCARTLAGLTAPQSILSGAGIALAAMLGDLAASWIKRRAGIKDFGDILPGHGGVLDRFDSFIGSGAAAGGFLCVAAVWR